MNTHSVRLVVAVLLAVLTATITGCTTRHNHFIMSETEATGAIMAATQGKGIAAVSSPSPSVKVTPVSRHQIPVRAQPQVRPTQPVSAVIASTAPTPIPVKTSSSDSYVHSNCVDCERDKNPPKVPVCTAWIFNNFQEEVGGVSVGNTGFTIEPFNFKGEETAIIEVGDDVKVDFPTGKKVVFVLRLYDVEKLTVDASTGETILAREAFLGKRTLCAEACPRPGGMVMLDVKRLTQQPTTEGHRYRVRRTSTVPGRSLKTIP